MGTATIVFRDSDEGVTITAEFDPILEKGANGTLAQQMAFSAIERWVLTTDRLSINDKDVPL